MGGDFRRDGDVAGIVWFQFGQSGKGQHVRGLIFAAETAVELLEFEVRSDQNVDGGAQSGGEAGASYKAVERLLGETDNAFLQNDQGDPGWWAAIRQRL